MIRGSDLVGSNKVDYIACTAAYLKFGVMIRTQSILSPAACLIGIEENKRTFRYYICQEATKNEKMAKFVGK